MGLFLRLNITMSNAFTNFLGQTLSSNTQVKDYRHAARLYVDDYFRLAPKAGFLYYVVFNINRNNNPIIQEYMDRNGRELGVLEKHQIFQSLKCQLKL